MGPIRSRFSSTVRIQILGAIPRAAELHAPSILARPQHCVPHIVASKTAMSDLVAFSLVKLSPHLVTHCVDSLIERPTCMSMEDASGIQLNPVSRVLQRVVHFNTRSTKLQRKSADVLERERRCAATFSQACTHAQIPVGTFRMN